MIPARRRFTTTLAAAAADAQISFTASRPGPVTAACQLAGINPHNFLPGDDHA